MGGGDAKWVGRHARRALASVDGGRLTAKRGTLAGVVRGANQMLFQFLAPANIIINSWPLHPFILHLTRSLLNKNFLFSLRLS